MEAQQLVIDLVPTSDGGYNLANYHDIGEYAKPVSIESSILSQSRKTPFDKVRFSLKELLLFDGYIFTGDYRLLQHNEEERYLSLYALKKLGVRVSQKVEEFTEEPLERVRHGKVLYKKEHVQAVRHFVCQLLPEIIENARLEATNKMREYEIKELDRQIEELNRKRDELLRK